uniref:Uncharacterized protein n=1 Tax=Candidatus Kentrum sp. FM TaxID=2126340 RepID=A0A450S0H4_9GAMM|nr:MAG: hypothetical protein BECKFM1743C_GA0114222_1002010 [Candidatus Kentron sp. FM]VFJ45509.1 MAG: hypothetical protein BECKFM1743A_GA0114220_1002510 [Candidatus Kentron sp. FM]VFK06721.1 MAG: hypothetical protein BECKFM1743B_GA0114221_1002310 [Candidatus Kentron sp. FM]
MQIPPELKPLIAQLRAQHPKLKTVSDEQENQQKR